MTISRGNVTDALRAIGRNEHAREALLTALRTLEAHLEARDFDVREQVTGPICDQMFDATDIVSKTIADGTIINARYTSKIIRDFLMAVPNPEFVWEPQTSRTLLHLSRGAKDVVVGGAYIGDHAVLIAKQIAANGGVVHAFEPSAESVALLQMNKEANGLENLKIELGGLWSKDQKILLEGFDSHAAPKSALDEGEGIEAQSLDSYCERNGIEELDLVMIDVEGGEFEILKGGTGILSQPANKAPHLVFEVHGSYIDWSSGLEKTDIISFLTDLGYHSFAIRDYHGNEETRSHVVEIIPPESCYLEGPPHGFNMLAVKDRTILEDGLFKIVHGVSPKLLVHRDPKYHAPTT